ncbi:hypothetical protein F441_03319 [Phytophthora nicotianae CJ01A1]|uniref:Uncharacterized protein n=1 Tax=Phytophthora nicotianae CJ01A1 TaxID=1317063 RepID=W2XLN5_PHYNI|nr:hypothetical protein F441_03319 [Phytophthora nicotianae CJ01A1]
MGTSLKRSRDQDSDSDEEAQRHPWRRHERSAAMDGIKRMRVSSPTDSLKNDVDSDMTDEEAATPRTIVPAAPEAGKTAIFNPYQSMPLSTNPRVELVEDDKHTETDTSESEDDKHTETDTSESEDEDFVRFEELPEDNDEPVDMDVD